MRHVLKVYEHLDFPMVKENIYGSRKAINQSRTAKNKRKTDDVQVSDYKVWTQTANDKERVCKRTLESTECLSLSSILLLLLFFVSVCPNFLSELPHCRIINKVRFFNASRVETFGLLPPPQFSAT
jgi:hypothetical protein